MTSDPLRRRSIAALIAVNLLWGISFPAMKAANLVMSEASGPSAGEAGSLSSDATDPNRPPQATNSLAAEIHEHTLSASFLTAVRFALSLVVLGVCVPRLFLGMKWSYWWMGVFTGLAFAPGFIMQNVGLNYVPASRSGFLTSLSVVFTPLVVMVLERRLPRRLVLIGIAIGLVGTAILTGLVRIEGPMSIRLVNGALSELGPGDWLTIVAAAIFTVQILLIDSFSRRMPAGQLTPGMFVATLVFGAGVFLAGYGVKTPQRDIHYWVGLLADIRFLGLITVLIIFCTVLAFHWMNKYQGHVAPAQAALIYTTEPIFATLWAMVLPGLFSWVWGLTYESERPGRELVVGGLFIVLGNVLALWPARPRGS